MTIEEKLKKKILDEFKSIRAFTQTANIPYSTIDTMLKKGIQGTGISTIIKVCSVLSIEIEALCNGEIVEKRKNIDALNILNDEGIKLYKKLDMEDRAEIRGEMKGMLRADKYQKNALALVKNKNDIIATARVVAYGGDDEVITYNEEEIKRIHELEDSLYPEDDD